MNFELLILLAPIIFFVPRTAKSIVAAVIIGVGGVIAATASVTTIMDGFSPLMPTLDRVSAVFMLCVSIVGTAAAIYAVGFTRVLTTTKSSTRISLHFACLVILFYALNGVLIATTRYEFLLWWELMTLSSFILVIFDASRKEVLHAGISYLILMHISFFFLLAGFTASDSDNMWSASSMGVWLMFLIGFGLKSALFPMHIWLPVTYLNTPAHVTVMMSGVMINMGIYGILRTTLAFDNPYIIGIILIITGIVSGLFGIVKAAMHNGLKRLLGYSSVENMGIITLAIGLGAIGKATANEALVMCGFGGALLHTLNHSSYKSMLFMAAGAVEQATGKSDLNRLGGLLKRMPITGWVFAVGALAICAIPPLSGFFSEFTIFTGLFSVVADGTNPIIGIVGILALALIGGLAIMAFSKVFSMTFLGQPRSCSAREATEANSTMLASYALPLLSILTGGVLFPYILFPESALLYNIVQVEIVMGVVIAVIVVLWFVRRLLQRRAKVDVQPTWGCAFAAPNKDMQYTSSSMSRELQDTISYSVKVDDAEIKEIFPAAQSFQTTNHDRTNIVVTRLSQRLLHRWTARLALFQTGKTNHYILQALLFLILILLLSVTGAI